MLRAALRRLAVAAAIGALSVTAHAQTTDTPSPESANWDVCNHSSFVLRVASAFTRNRGVSVQGWDVILPGSCQAYTPPSGSPRYLYAESLAVHQGGIREWTGNRPLCANPVTGFSVPDTADCAALGLETRGYLSVRPDEPVTTLVEPAQYSAAKAVVAAQQRLLRDAGYTMSRIDGVAGRRTARTLATFRTDAGLAPDTDVPTVLNALVEAARLHKETLGLEVCNESSATIWTAVALKDETEWRSRGWWTVAPGACTRPLDQPLTDTEAHIFALQEAPDGSDIPLRTSAVEPAQFCISEAQFDAVGNTLCSERGYALASFRTVPTDEPGTRMRLTDADFAAPLPGGLRR